MRRILSILLIGLLVVACSKEKNIEKNLWKKGGKWVITSSEFTAIRANGNNEHYIDNNAGYIQFNEDKTGYFIENDGEKGDIFTYSVTKTSLIIDFHDGSADSGTFEIEWKKDKFTLTRKESGYDEEAVFNGTDYDIVKIKVDTTIILICEKVK